MQGTNIQGGNQEIRAHGNKVQQRMEEEIEERHQSRVILLLRFPL